MPTTKVLRARGATVTVAAYGETLFTADQDIPRWTKRFSRKITDSVSAEAPSHNYGLRPLRPHDRGVRLKESFTSTTQADPVRMRVDAAVGSRSPYSTFVDQGTGIYNPEGGSPYEAKVLPPWRQGEGSLYESTWTPGKNQVAPVMIRGQKGQRFMEKGLNRAFLFMMRRAAQVASEPRVGQAMNFFPENLALRGSGNTPVDAAFRANMEEWRSWRDAAFRRGDQLGSGQQPGRTRKGYEEARARYREAQKNLAASKANAARREREQGESIRDKQRREQAGRERREREAQKKREREEMANRQRDRKRRTQEARAEAIEFARGLDKRGISSRGTFTTDPKTGLPAYGVTYSQGGVSKTRYFTI